MEIFVNGQAVTLTQNNFVAKGGEGKIFQRGNLAYKIYEDLSKMIPAGKIVELSQLNKPNILRPIDLIINKKRQNVGFTMNWLGDDVVALCKPFTNTFRQNNGIEDSMIVELVENMKKLTQFIHSHNCLIVDGNELNYLVGNDFLTPYFIDVNSWQTKSYPATAIMPSIRDWTTESFTPLTDWFSFAIVTFQLFTGIHPFKGKHKQYRKNDFVSRVKNRISVFNGEVRLPPTTRDFNIIPASYKDWYYKIFENGDRKPPPEVPGYAGVAQITVKLIKSTGSFEIESIREFDERILYHNPTTDITKTESKIYLGRTDYKISQGVEVLLTPLEQIPVLVKISNKKIHFKSLKPGYTFKEVDLNCSDMMIVNDVLYLKNGPKLIEMDFKTNGQIIIPLIKMVWNIESLSSKLLSNIIYQSVLGKAFLCIPLPNKSGKSSFIVKPIPELDDYQIIDAKYDNHVCILMAHKGAEYYRIILTFDEKYNSYKCRVVRGVDYIPLNFIVLDNGVCINIIEDNLIEIFFNKISKVDVNQIEDPDIDNSMRLCKDGTIVKFFKDKTIYSMKMK